MGRNWRPGRYGLGVYPIAACLALPSDPQLAQVVAMLLAQDFRRQAHVCARLADDCDDPRLAERLRAMASDLLAKAEDLKERQACRDAVRRRV